MRDLWRVQPWEIAERWTPEQFQVFAQAEKPYQEKRERMQKRAQDGGNNNTVTFDISG